MRAKQQTQTAEEGTARARLMTEALKIFARDGFEGASTRDIAAAAGVNHSLIPYHFGSKDGLWRETMSELIAGFRQALEQPAASRTETPGARLRATIRSFVLFCAERPEFHRVMTAEWAQGTDRIRWLGETHIKPVSQRMIALIAAAQRSGEAVAGEPIRLNYAVIGVAATAFAMAKEYKMLCGRDPRTPDGIEETVRIIERLLLRP